MVDGDGAYLRGAGLGLSGGSLYAVHLRKEMDENITKRCTAYDRRRDA